MTDKPAGTHNTRVVAASPEAIYQAFMDPDILVQWLPPARMTGKVHAFDGRVGGGYRMSLFYPDDETAFRGKSAALEDRVDVRFVELSPPHRIVEAVTFETTDPALMGEMTVTWTFEAVIDGTLVTVEFTDLPPGVKAEDNEEGARLSLEQLARRFVPGAS